MYVTLLVCVSIYTATRMRLWSANVNKRYATTFIPFHFIILLPSVSVCSVFTHSVYYVYKKGYKECRIKVTTCLYVSINGKWRSS